jgi:hypothetical protein
MWRQWWCLTIFFTADQTQPSELSKKHTFARKIDTPGVMEWGDVQISTSSPGLEKAFFSF